MLYYSVYTDEASSELELDMEKFSTVDIGSPRSLSSNHSTKNSFKELLNENMDQYINSIKPEYEKYKVNHCHFKKIADNNSNINVLNDKNLLYQSHLTVLTCIDKDFIINEKEFKIRKELLSQKKEFIAHSNHELIEKCGRIELELEKTLEYSHKMSNYISVNLTPLENYVNEVVIRINKWKDQMNFLKRNIINNSTQLLLKGIKAKSQEKALMYLDKLKKLKDIIDLLKIISTNPKKYKLALELITKGKEVIQKMKIIKNPSINLLSLFEKELNDYSSKCCEQINTEFDSVLIELFKDFLKFKNEKESKNNDESINQKEQYNIDKYSFDKLSSSSQENNILLNNLALPIRNTSKVKQMIQCFIFTDVIDALCVKIRSLIMKVVNEALKSSISIIKSEMSNEKKNLVFLEK